jgi:hypothetical protein
MGFEIKTVEDLQSYVAITVSDLKAQLRDSQAIKSNKLEIVGVIKILSDIQTIVNNFEAEQED